MRSDPELVSLDAAGSASGVGLFDPADLDRMVAAHRAALTISCDESGPFALVDGHELRASLACAIVREACRGVRDVEQLKARALRALDPTPFTTARAGRNRRPASSSPPAHQADLPSRSEAISVVASRAFLEA